MKRFIAIALVLASACKGNEETPRTAAKATPPANDPWAKKSAADVKDNDLARLIELAQNGPGKDMFPQADAVIALERDDITLKSDGTVVTKHHSIVKLLDPQRGKDKYADLHIPFDGRRETLVIERARTVNDDGKEHAVGADHVAQLHDARWRLFALEQRLRVRVRLDPHRHHRRHQLDRPARIGRRSVDRAHSREPARERHRRDPPGAPAPRRRGRGLRRAQASALSATPR